MKHTINKNDIAVIGMACHFPGCDTIDQYWDNLKNGVNSITQFSKEDLESAGISEDLLNNPNYVRARGRINDIDKFDADFFDFSPLEASALDPQHRFLLTTSWEAMEYAGYNPMDYQGKIGIFAGCGFNYYMLHSGLLSNEELISKIGGYNLLLLTDKNFLATRVAYKLNLKGPAFTVQTACSTSLVAIYNACKSLKSGDADMALAGAVTITIPQDQGYLYREGMVLSKDGYCRPFDKDGSGFVDGNGVGVVVLKMAVDALEDGDTIHAIIKGAAINNDGNDKTSFSAPSVEGECEAIREALGEANVSADDIDYIEAHGTATKLGDPIELEGLKKAFSEDTNRKGYCAIGSVKSGIGHMDTAAGMGGLIKTVLALRHGKITPSLNFSAPNPLINFQQSPFYVNTKLADWPERDFPSKAGVSAFGIGGTNAHVVLEKAPAPDKITKKSDHYSIVLSAKTKGALVNYIQKFIAHLHQYPDQQIGNIAYTLQIGRASFTNRIAFICKDKQELLEQLKKELTGHRIQHHWFIKQEHFNPAQLELDLAGLLFEEEHLLEHQNYKALQDLIVDICHSSGLQLIDDNNIKHKKAAVFQLLANIWIQGVKVPWQALYPKQEFYRIPLPTYCFEKQRHWLEPQESSKENSNASARNRKNAIAQIRKSQNEWFYKKIWKNKKLAPYNATENAKKTYLIFDDELGFCDALSDKLHADHIIHVKAASGFKKEDNVYRIDPGNIEDYHMLIKSLIAQGHTKIHILHAFSMSKLTNEILTKDAFSLSQAKGFYSLLKLLQTINSNKKVEEVRIIALTNYMHVVSKNDVVSAEKSTIQSFINGVSQEYPAIYTKCIDILTNNDKDNDKLLNAISDEITSITTDKAVAYRDGQRWVLDVAAVALKPENTEPLIKKGGSYIITGGLGHIGLAIAAYISKTPKTHIVLTSRSDFLEEEKWERWLQEHPADNPVSIKINKLLRIRKKGVHIVCVKADVSDYKQMRRVFSYTEDICGKINGVIHSAGSLGADYFKAVSDCDMALCEAQFTSKVYGTLVLAELLKDKKPDFYFSMSSIATVLGGLGMIPYAAANSFMDSFADSTMVPPHIKWINVNWDGWYFKQATVAQEDIFGAQSGETYLSKKEGIEVFEMILNTSIKNIIVSTTDIQSRLDRWIRILPVKKQAKKTSASKNTTLSVEDRVSALFKDFLQLDKVALEDDFFDLGGNSLLSVSFIDALNEAFNTELPASIIIEQRTINDLSNYIKANVLSDKEPAKKLPFSLVKLKKGSNKKSPLFLIHPIGGTVYFYQDIVSRLPDDQTVYGIQSAGLDGFHTPDNDLVAMAKHYLKLVQLIQPSGPYYIGGASFGGMVAYEMASQLIEKGQEIEKIFMIDTPGEHLMSDSSLNEADNFIYYLWNILKDVSIDKEAFSNMTSSQKTKFLEENLEDHYKDFSFDYEVFTDVFHANMQAMNSYKVNPLNIRGVYFQATQDDGINPYNMQKEWKTKFKHGMEVIEVEGNHLTMNNLPNSKVISSYLTSWIDQ